MKKAIVFAGVALVAASVMAAGRVDKGTQELSVAGNLDRDSLALGAGYGYFIMNGLEIGVSGVGSYEDMGNKSDVRTFGGDIFAQYNFDLDTPYVPFVGVAGGLRYMKVKFGDLGSDSETAAIGEGQAGVKSFIAQNVAIALYAFYDFSNKEVFTDKDEMKKNNFGLRLGMNTYF